MRFFLIGLLMGVSLQALDNPKEIPHRHEFVIGISPYLDKSAKDEVYRGLVQLLVQDLPLDSSVSLYDAFQLKSITQVTLPDIRAFTSPKTRANQFSGAVQNLRSFLAKDHPRPTNALSNFAGAIRVPQFCDFLSDNRQASDRPLTVLLIGSPLYQDVKEPAFSMADGYFPSDGHLQATCEKSVFGSRGPTNALRPMTVHWVYFGDPWISDLHREKITRFWSLFLEARASQLQTFCADLPTAFKAFAQPVTGAGPFAQRWSLASDPVKIEMLRISRNVDLIDWITRDSLPQVAIRPPASLVGPLKIGIRWKSNIDLDLYASPRHEADTLYFEHPRSAEGFYYKDHRSSPGREFEFIEFETPVDIRQVEASVNFYQGTCPGGPRGEVRIEFDGRIYSAPFVIPAARGNLGRSGHSQQEFWARIPIQEILRLNTAGNSAG